MNASSHARKQPKGFIQHLFGDWKKSSPASGNKKGAGFTLIELIIVITILVILGIVVVMLIDPAEILAQSRDSQRISDLATIKGATQLVLASGVPSNYAAACDTVQPMTATAKIWTSTVTAGGSGYSFVSATSTRSLVDNTGWIKIDYTTPSTGRALTSLPVDPTNQYVVAGTAGLYYRWGCTYISGKYEYEVDAALESAKYKPGCSGATCDDKGLTDGGNSNATVSPTGNNDRYEVGNNLNVLPATALSS